MSDRPLRTIAGPLALLLAVPASALEPGDLVAVTASPSPAQVLALPAATGLPEVIASGGLLVAPRDVSSVARTGKLWVVDRDAGPGGSGAVIEIDPAGYEPGDPAANQRPVASGNLLVDPESIAVLKDGASAVIGDPTAGAVILVTRSGQQQKLDDYPAAAGVAVDLDDGIYAVSALGAREVRRWNPLSGELELVSSGGFFGTPRRLAFEPTRKLLVADSGTASGTDGRVVRVDPSLFDSGNPGANQSLLSDGGSLVDPSDVAVDPLGTIYASDPGAENGAGAIYRVNATNGATSHFAALDDVIALDVFRRGPKRGEIAVADAGPGRRVVLVDPDTAGQRLLLSDFPEGFPVDVEWEESGDLLVLTSNTPTVLRLDPATGLRETLDRASGTGTNDFNVTERMVREDTRLWIGDSATFVSPTFQLGAIFELQLPSRTRTLFTGGGAKFRVRSIGLVPGDGDFVVGTTDSGITSFDVVRVDRVSKARTPLTSDGDVSEPADLVVDAAGTTAYVAAATGGGGDGALTAVDLASGAQTVISAPGAVIGPQGVGWDLDGMLLVSDRPFVPGGFQREGRIQRFAPMPGASAALVSAGGLLQDPQGLAVFAPEPAGALAAAVATLGALAAARARPRRRPRRS